MTIYRVFIFFQELVWELGHQVLAAAGQEKQVQPEQPGRHFYRLIIQRAIELYQIRLFFS